MNGLKLCFYKIKRKKEYGNGRSERRVGNSKGFGPQNMDNLKIFLKTNDSIVDECFLRL